MSHVENLRKICGIEVSADIAIKMAENATWRGQHPGTDFLAVVTATNYESLSELLKYCVKNDVKIVTRSGGTALTGGSSISKKRAENAVILKLYKNGRIRIHEILTDGSARIFPGNTTLQLNTMIMPLGRIVTVDLGIGDIKGAAQILGYIATDAAGSGAAFKGRARDIVQSVKVMMLDGKIYDLPSIDKDAPRLDDIIGMGGTTGIILEAVIKTGELPKSRQVAAIRVNNISQMYDLLESFKKYAWPNLNLFERINSELFAEVVSFTNRQENTETKKINGLGTGDILLIELVSPHQNYDLLTVLKKSLSAANLINSAIIAKDQEHGNFLLSYRVVNASRACDMFAEKSGGEVVAFDISVPTGDDDEFPSNQLIENLKQKIPGIKIFSFGHAAGVEKISATTRRGGTAIHFNPVAPEGTSPDLVKWLRREVFSEVSARGGKIVSEHTPGTKLVADLKKFKPDEYSSYLSKIAKWNPDCILNPDAYVSVEDVAKHNTK